MATKGKATMGTSSHVQKLAKGNLEFSLNLYKEFVKISEGSNVFFSPFSITVALAMVNAGARNNTSKELRETMKLNELSEDQVVHSAFRDILKSLNLGKGKEVLPFILHVANRMYVEESYEILQEYAKLLADHYFTDALNVDFIGNAEKARGKINSFVEEVTREKIRNLIPEGALNALSRVVLVNAIYFKGSWEKQFKTNSTSEGSFYRSKNDIAKTMFMHQKSEFPFSENYELSCKVLQLPYVGDRLAMLMILPDEIDGLATLEEQFTPTLFHSLLKPMSTRKVKVAIPKFKLEVGASLKDVLQRVGIKEMFSLRDADLSGLSPKDDLFVSDVFHKAFVDVNEEGTEAAAATAVVLMMRSIQIDPEFIADHPFLFVIYDKQSELILFMGRFLNPPSSASNVKEEL